MPTFIYAPGVKVYIDTAKHGLVNVSEDLSNGTMVRRSDGVSTFNWDMNNPRRKYDSVFAPNDRVVVLMKRVAWVRTFTGLLNSVPLMTAWPRDVSLAASCSLKRLQYWYWDPHSAATQNMIREALAATQSRKGDSDGGVTNAVVTILDKVVGWPASKVHIARIPDDWFEVARKVAVQVDEAAEQADAMAAAFYSTLGGAGSVAGATSGYLVDGRLQEGQYGGVKLAGEQLRNAETIYTIAKQRGLSDRDAMLGLACAMQESQLKNISYGDRDSLGLFQQRASWGTATQRTTPSYAAGKFFETLAKIGNRDSMRETQAIQAVQRSAFPDAYQKWVPMATAVVRVLTGIINSTAATSQLATDPGFAGNKTALTTGAKGRSTGLAMAQTGVDFVERFPSIKYTLSGGSGVSWVSQEPPSELDCGTFTQAIYFRTLGTLNGMPRTVSAITDWCVSSGGRRVSAEVAAATPGALICKTHAHVETSLGGGKTVAAKTFGKYAKVTDYGSVESLARSYDYGLLLPGLEYTVGGQVVYGNPGTLTGGQAASGALATPTYGSDAPGYNPNDPFDKLFGDNAWVATAPEDDPLLQLSGALTGIRALLNDEPLLPYIKNLFNSTMRSFCSAPNGDLIAWFPDYYGLWGTAAKMVLQPIEVMDFTVEWADDYFVTHQFTIAGKGITTLDIGTGDIADSQFFQEAGPDVRTTTLGIASIDIPAMMYALFGIDATDQEAKNFAQYIYKRFGARPSYQPMPGLQGPKAEFFSAMFMFMRQWAYQYNADIPLTFMPELFPGMLIQIPAFDFQAYVTTVTHTFRFGQGGGFATTVNIAAPARLPKKGKGNDNVLVGLPLAGDYKPGRGLGNTQPSASDFLPTGYSEHQVR